jgi:membrane-bound serine protease (ClpP class)
MMMLAAARKIRIGAASSKRSSIHEMCAASKCVPPILQLIVGLLIIGALAAALVFTPALRAAPQQSNTTVAADGSAVPAKVIELRIGDEVEPIMAEYIDDGIEQAAREHARLVLITMDTPGGLEDSMKEIIQHILDSPVPVVVYVWPTGSRGASAGFFILMSADVAAMAPGTHAGAASPIMAVGGVPVNIDDVLKKKILNDATAYIRSYTDKRGRNVSLAESAVVDGKAFTDTESLDGKLVEMIVNSPEDLIAQLNGRTITRFDGSTARLDLTNPQVEMIGLTARQRFLARIVQPDVFFILLIVGVIGLYAEFTHPGMILPGVVGAVAGVLALFAMHILPVNFAGLLLIILGLAMLALEAKFTSHGVLALGGVTAMLLGALLLIRSPITGAGVSLGVALGVTAPAAAVTFFLMRLVLTSRSWKQTGGADHFIGAEAEVTEAIAPVSGDGAAGGSFQGMIRVHGELWRAVAPEAIPVGARVRVVRIAGLTAHVAAVSAVGHGSHGGPADRLVAPQG